MEKEKARKIIFYITAAFLAVFSFIFIRYFIEEISVKEEVEPQLVIKQSKSRLTSKDSIIILDLLKKEKFIRLKDRRVDPPSFSAGNRNPFKSPF